MLVYVTNKHKKPLMPCSVKKARLLLSSKEAKVIRRNPFTIQLKFGSSGYKQPIVLGVDAGSKVIGLSATTEKKELFSGECTLRKDVIKLLADRSSLRRTRRSSKTRYRKSRFLNRVSIKRAGWVAPSIRNKIQTHLQVVKKLHKILPITKIIVETAAFDIQKIRNPEIGGADYQNGSQLGFFNVREYVLFRDGHRCQNCKGSSNDKILNVHHLESRKTGGDAPNNLLTLCSICHDKYHSGKIKLSQKRGNSFRDAAFMGIMRWKLLDELKLKYREVQMTYGYLTKNTRIELKLPKSHYVDAYCISGNLESERLKSTYLIRKVRSHDRVLHKQSYSKGHIKIKTRQSYLVRGFRKYDFVSIKGTNGFLTNRRIKGSFEIVNLEGKVIRTGSSSKTVLIEHSSNMLFQLVSSC